MICEDNERSVRFGCGHSNCCRDCFIDLRTIAARCAAVALLASHQPLLCCLCASSTRQEVGGGRWEAYGLERRACAPSSSSTYGRCVGEVKRVEPAERQCVEHVGELLAWHGGCEGVERGERPRPA